MGWPRVLTVEVMRSCGVLMCFEDRGNKNFLMGGVRGVSVRGIERNSSIIKMFFFWGGGVSSVSLNYPSRFFLYL